MACAGQVGQGLGLSSATVAATSPEAEVRAEAEVVVATWVQDPVISALGKIFLQVI